MLCFALDTLIVVTEDLAKVVSPRRIGPVHLPANEHKYPKKQDLDYGVKYRNFDRTLHVPVAPKCHSLRNGDILITAFDADGGSLRSDEAKARNR